MMKIVTREISKYNIMVNADTGSIMLSEGYLELGTSAPIYNTNFETIDVKKGTNFVYLIKRITVLDDSTNVGAMVGKYWMNNKNGEPYYTFNIGVNATNSCDGQLVVFYKKNNELYVRDINEFIYKFTPGDNIDEFKHKAQ